MCVRAVYALWVRVQAGTPTPQSASGGLAACCFEADAVTLQLLRRCRRHSAEAYGCVMCTHQHMPCTDDGHLLMQYAGSNQQTLPAVLSWLPFYKGPHGGPLA